LKRLLGASDETDRESLVPAMTRLLIRHHDDWSIYRRSLRWLTKDNPLVAEARRSRRHRQVQLLRSFPSNKGREVGEVFFAIPHVEALCDTLADGITAELSVTKRRWEIGNERSARAVLGLA